jgi:hypothetical protein
MKVQNGLISLQEIYRAQRSKQHAASFANA